MAKRTRGRGPTKKRAVWEELGPGRVQATPEVAAMIAAGELEPDPEVWLNEQYAVIVQRRDDGTVYVLRVRRIDGGVHMPWEILQRIKDELAGEDAEAVELFPAVERRKDVQDRWLWCVRPGERWPLGIPAPVADEPAPVSYGHCDTCGARCDADGCTWKREHLAALDGTEGVEQIDCPPEYRDDEEEVTGDGND